MTKDQTAQEIVWKKEAAFFRKQFVNAVSKALRIRSPTKRKELYQDWKFTFGNETARRYASYSEKVFSNGDATLYEKFIEMDKVKNDNNT